MEVKPERYSLKVPGRGKSSLAHFEVVPRWKDEGGTKLLVDFIQKGEVVRTANANIVISKRNRPAKTVVIRDEIPIIFL